MIMMITFIMIIIMMAFLVERFPEQNLLSQFDGDVDDNDDNDDYNYDGDYDDDDDENGE